MFGRRNPDRPLNPKPSEPPETDLDLDLLEDLPDTPAPAPPAPETSDLPPNPPSAYPAWPSSASLVIGSSPQPPAETDQSPPPAVPPAAAVTQELPTLAPPAVAAPAPAASDAAPAARPRAIAESVIGPDDFFDGRYRSERGVRIQGNARGSIESRQYIFVEAGAQVEADLSAEDITVSGDFKGKIECRRRLEITDTGKVQGEVQTSLLVVQEGGAIDGALHMGHPQEVPAGDGA